MVGKEKRLAVKASLPDCYVVRPERFELPTHRFVACCSIQLSHERPTTANIGETRMTVKHFFLHLVYGQEKIVVNLRRRAVFTEALRLNPQFRLDHAKIVS